MNGFEVSDTHLWPVKVAASVLQTLPKSIYGYFPADVPKARRDAARSQEPSADKCPPCPRFSHKHTFITRETVRDKCGIQDSSFPTISSQHDATALTLT